MGTHIQGVALLIVLLGALWGASRLAAPTISEAISDEGAIIARSPDPTASTTPEDGSLSPSDEPLNFDEITNLQWLLGIEGYLSLDTDIDGVYGPITRAAVTQAKEALDIPSASDRVLLSLLEGLNAENLPEE